MNIQSLAQTIKAWQSSKGMSNAQLLKRFPAIGSPRTLNRLAEGQLDNVESERYEHEYQRVVDMLELESGGIAGEVIYDDLYFCVSIMLKVRDLLKERGNNRLLIVEGPSGSGKSTLAMMIASKFGNAMVYTEANETWKDSILTFLRGLLRALGVSEPPKVIDDCMAKLLALLTTGEPRCLLIDEAHHLGPRTLNLIKTILNQTGSHIIFFAIPKLLQDLERAAYMEAMQLTHN
jgi:DNA transposition AAA+ family ATPase